MNRVSFSFLLLVLASPGLAQNFSVADARSMADRATQAAREGRRDEALRIYKDALASAPDDISILRDYAIVLGWDEKYDAAIPVIRRVLEKESIQPEWALREFARTFLFGNEAAEAFKYLDQLVERGDYSEQTLNRRALALRWLDFPEDAEAAYREMLQRYPESGTAYTGLALVAADRNLSEALHILESAPGSVRVSRDVLVARLQILNWMGRHYEAQRVIATLPPELSEDRDVIKEAVAAARWGGNPSGAIDGTRRLLSLHPDEASRDLLNRLRSEYGQSLAVQFRYSRDSDGLIDRTASSGFTLHLNPSHAIRTAYQYRWLQQDGRIRTLLNYELGWSASLSPRVSVYTALSNVDYRTPGLPRKFAGDGSLSIVASDSVRLSGGAGVIVMDAFQSLENQVRAPFGFADLGLQFGRERIQGRYSFYAFTNKVDRSRIDAQFMRRVVSRSHLRVSLGARSTVMTHSAGTGDFYSPSRFHAHFGAAQLEGNIGSSLSFTSEFAGGWQSEPDSPWLHPVQASGGVAWQPSRHWRLSVDGGKSTASVDRIQPGVRTYSRWSASASLEIRMP